MTRLAQILKVQSIVFAVYSLTFLLAPDFTMDTVFGWADQPTVWVRAVGVPFAGVAWAGWLISEKLDTRLDLVWPLALVPGLFVGLFIWERTRDTYEGTDRFFWVSLVVSLFFFIAVGWQRLAVGRSQSPAGL